MAYPKAAVSTVRIEHAPAGLRLWSATRRRAGERIGMVPTMGALHEGHFALVRAMSAVSDRVVVSIFVNPTQFAPGEDFSRYPRREADDLARLAELGVDVAYLPTTNVMYPQGFETTVTVGGALTSGLEATVRPGHFTGVATIVAKLLLQTMPDIAAFGEKDYQQLQIVRRLVRDLDIPVEIAAVPTVRDAEGLALSSRNAYLDPAQLSIARQMNKILAAAADRVRSGASGQAACADAERALLAAGFSSVDYVALADAETLEPVDRPERPARILAAARLGATRLIDNIAVQIQAGKLGTTL